MKENYFVLSRCEDEVCFSSMTKKQVESLLEEGIEQGTAYLDGVAVDWDLDAFPANSTLIIKGSVVVPFFKGLSID